MRRISRLAISGIAIATVAAALASSAVQAHAIWFAERAGKTALVYGMGADDLDTVKRLPRITSVAGVDADGKPIKVSLRVDGPLPVVDSDEPPAVVAAVMDYGIWSTDPSGKWYEKGRDEIKNATISEHNFKYAVHINQMPAKGLPFIAGQRLQLIPIGKGIPPLMGQPVTLRAFYDGKPAANVEIMGDYVNDPDQKPMKTDAAGDITLPVRNQGLNVIVGILKAPSDNPAKYTQMEHRASLSFVLPHIPE
jgi:nickel transport protein